jgi:hypothetical protein
MEDYECQNLLSANMSTYSAVGQSKEESHLNYDLMWVEDINKEIAFDSQIDYTVNSEN